MSFVEVAVSVSLAFHGRRALAMSMFEVRLGHPDTCLMPVAADSYDDFDENNCLTTFTARIYVVHLATMLATLI